MEKINAQDCRTEFRLKLGSAEIEFIGDAEFLKNEIMPAVSRIVSVVEATPIQLSLPESEKSYSQKGIVEDQTNFKPLATNAGSLASHIKKHNADKNQRKRFLVTADWIRLRGKPDLTTASVANALQENQQAKLTNPADCLNKNASKGYCEKTPDGFFITPEGLEFLGLDR